MFLDINKVVSSADFGLVFISYFGGEMSDSYKKKVNKSYAGRYGSMALGIFNGGGYHALEKNMNKSIEGRVTIRPLPDLIPGCRLPDMVLMAREILNPHPTGIMAQLLFLLNRSS